MTKDRGFQYGSGNVFTCECCGRRTRKTRDNSSDSCCWQCFELAGIDNHFNDNGKDSDIFYLEEAEQLLAEIKKLGGNPDNAKEDCTYIPWRN